MTRSQLLSMCRNSLADGDRGVDIILPNEKRVAAAAERAGVVSIRRTAERFGGLTVWYAKLAATK